MRPLLVLLALTTAAASQPAPPDPLPDSVRARLQVELREMKRTDQRVRAMYQYGTFSPCVADSLQRALDALPSTEAVIRRTQQLSAEARARTSDAEKAVLLQILQDADTVILTRLRGIIASYGWPSAERTGADVNPVVFLLHAAGSMDELRPTLLAEVRAGRMPARTFATALDKARKVRGELQLYGTGDEYDPETGTIEPPRIADIDATNAARREIGLPPLARYRLAESPGRR